MAETEGPHVSLYMPMAVRGPETQQNHVHMKNVRARAEKGLVEGGMRATDAIDMLAPIAAMEDDFGFWQHQADGLAVFLNQNGVHRFRVPIVFPEMAFVEPRFHLKPLMPLLAEGVTFHVLAISSNHTRLLACTPAAQSEVKLDGMPRGIADVLWPDDTEKQQQFHSFYSGASGQTSMTHGSGASQPDHKNDLLRYFQQVDEVLAPYMRKRGDPLVLACVDYLAPLYREANSYGFLVESPVSGSPDRAHDEDLRSMAWELVRPGVEAAREDAVGQYRQLAGTGQTTNDVSEAALAAVTGKVDKVFVMLDREVWGKVDGDAFKVETHATQQPGDVDLLDFTAAHTLMAGGTVYGVEEDEAPEPTGVAAVFRYAA